MPRYDKSKIRGLLRKADRTKKKAVRGQVYEDLASYLFSCLPGIRSISTNIKNTFATEEIDLACYHVQDPTGLPTVNPNFLVECKGWRDPVNSEQVAWFLLKIEHRGLDFGVLIAAKGITGVEEHLKAANFLVSFALALRKIKMVIITQAEIEVLESGEELAELIIRKVNQLHATGGKCY